MKFFIILTDDEDPPTSASFEFAGVSLALPESDANGSFSYLDVRRGGEIVVHSAQEAAIVEWVVGNVLLGQRCPPHFAIELKRRYPMLFRRLWHLIGVKAVD